MACTPGAAGGCFTAGWISPAGLAGPESVVAKYDVNGTRLWTQPWLEPSCTAQQFWHATSSRFADTMAACGTCLPKGSAHYSWLVAKYDGSGNRLWGVIYGGLGSNDEEPQAVVMDKAGNVYAAGHTVAPAEATRSSW